jgi:hypothetical protein
MERESWAVAIMEIIPGFFQQFQPVKKKLIRVFPNVILPGLLVPKMELKNSKNNPKL